MKRDDVVAATADQRRMIADLIEGLDDAELTTPSLCTGWDVKTVAAHLLSAITDGPAAVTRLSLRYGGLARATDILARRRARLPASDIARELRRLADLRYWSAPPRGDRGPLADVLVHGGDIRIPLGLPFDPAPELVGEALERLTLSTPTFLLPPSRLRGIRLHATDLWRSWRSGLEIRGPAAALMMSVCGRQALWDALDGPGVPLLARRIAD